MRRLRGAALGGAIAIALAVAGCGGEEVALSGSIEIDGSNSVAPLTRAMAERFMAEHPDVRISVGASGTQAGFRALCRGETDASDAVERIDPATHAACERAGVEPEEIAIANDAVILMVHPENPVACLTTRQLNQIWHRDSEVTERWNQVDDLDPPYDGELNAYGPGTDTESFAFFNTVINGRVRSYRDYNNVLHKEGLTVDAIGGAPGFFGYAHYRFYAPKARTVKAIAVDSGDGCVRPTPATIADRSFKPLSRTLYLHASRRAMARPEMAAFLRFYLDNVEEVAPEVGYVPLTDAQRQESDAALD